MKKILLTALVLFFATASVAVAEDLAGKWAINGNILGVIPDADVDETIFYGGSVEYNYTSYLAGEIEVGYAGMDDMFESIKFGEISYVPLLINLKARYPEGKVNPFIYGGLGVIFVDYETEQWVKNLGVSVDVDSGFAFQIGAGADIFIADNIALFTKLGYMWSEVDASATVPGYTATAEVSLDNFFVGGGVKIVF